MSNKKYAIILRHGPTHSNETIDYNNYINFFSSIVIYINKYLLNFNIDIKNINIKIFTSPYTRCYDTAKLLSSHLKIIKKHGDIKISKYDDISRWNSKRETREQSISRGNKCGNHIYEKLINSDNNELNIYISHSSMIPALISGMMGKKLKKIKLHTACLSIINISDRQLEIFNKSFKS